MQSKYVVFGFAALWLVLFVVSFAVVWVLWAAGLV